MQYRCLIQIRRLIVYPKGNEKDDGSGFISMYVEIDSKITTEVFAELRFFVYNKKETKYFTIQGQLLLTMLYLSPSPHLYFS